MKKKAMIIAIVVVFIAGFFFYSNNKHKQQVDDKPTATESKQVKNNTPVENNNKQVEKKETQDNNAKKIEEQNKKDAEVKSNNKKVIVIDPGHANRSNLEKEALSPESKEMKIKDGGGAEGINTKIPEYKVTMKVSMKLKEILEGRGYVVKMTKTQDSESLGNIERAEIGNKVNAALVVRIHADSSDSSSAKGASMLVPAAINENTRKIHDASKKYGEIMLKTLTSEVDMANRGVVERNDMTGFNWSKVPVVLVEMGFLSNPQEEKLLSSDEYENKIANALANGIDKAF